MDKAVKVGLRLAEVTDLSVQGTAKVFLFPGLQKESGWSSGYLVQPSRPCCGFAVPWLAQQSWRCWAGLLGLCSAL